MRISLTILWAVGAVIFAAYGIAQAKEISADGHAWKTYVNARFGYSLCYPADILVAQGVTAANGDGQEFVAQDGSHLVVYGGYNALFHSLKQERAFHEDNFLDGDKGRVTYQAMGKNWFVFSGMKGSNIYYSKTLYNKKEDEFDSFEITYTPSVAEMYAPLAAHMAECFATAKQ